MQRSGVVNRSCSILQIHNAVVVKWLALFISTSERVEEFAADDAPDFIHRLSQAHKGLS
jgi:hypothetical protein